MSKMKDLYGILTEWYPDGNYNEQQLWEAIAESQGMDYAEIADGDLAEWLQHQHLPQEYLQVS